MTITTDDHDWLLQKIVNLVNGTSREIPITLLFQGVFVSGVAVGVEHYLKYSKEMLVEEKLLPDYLLAKGSPVPEEGINGKNYILNLTLVSTIENSVASPDDWQNKPHYVHLRDAKFHNGTKKGIGKQNGAFWRGRIDRVSGFYLG